MGLEERLLEAVEVEESWLSLSVPGLDERWFAARALSEGLDELVVDDDEEERWFAARALSDGLDEVLDDEDDERWELAKEPRDKPELGPHDCREPSFRPWPTLVSSEDFWWLSSDDDPRLILGFSSVFWLEINENPGGGLILDTDEDES